MLVDFQDDETLLGADDVGHISGIHGEGLVLELRRQHAALEVAQVAALGGGGAIGRTLGHLIKLCSTLDVGQQIVGFLLGSGQLVGGRRNFLLLLGIVGAHMGCGGNQDLAQADLLGLINQVGQHVFLLGGKHLLGLRLILVFEFILELGMAALEF